MEAYRNRPAGRFTIPLFSRNPNYINADGIKWRTRMLIAWGCGAVFLIAAMICGALFAAAGF